MIDHIAAQVCVLFVLSPTCPFTSLPNSSSPLSSYISYSFSPSTSLMSWTTTTRTSAEELGPRTKRTPLHKKGDKSSNNIQFEASDQFTQAGLTESRKAEWAKWKQFNAVYPVSGPDLEQLLAQGHKPSPLQWIEIDKNEHKRREGGLHVAPLFKSRLTSRGDLEETAGARTDSPTCDIEGLNLLLSWASCEGLTVESHHERLLPRVSVGTVDLNETTTWRSAGP